MLEKEKMFLPSKEEESGFVAAVAFVDMDGRIGIGNEDSADYCPPSQLVPLLCFIFDHLSSKKQREFRAYVNRR